MRQTTKRLYSRAAAMLLMMLLTTVTAWANDAVTYIDMNGKTQTVTEYTEVTSGMSLSWASGTYVVKSDVTLSGCIKPKEAYIDLIVCDGKTLTVNGSSDGAFWVKTLNIYAQSNGTGVVNAKKKTRCYNLNIAGGTVTLDADGDSYGLYIFQSGSNYGLTVNGGNVTILNKENNAGTIGFEGAGFVTQNGGTLTVTNSAKTGNYAIYGNPGTINFNGGTAEINGIIRLCQTINLNGGNVTVNGEINKESGYTVTYGFTHATDSYYIQSFVGVYSHCTRTVQVSDGQRLTDGTNIYTGTLTDSQISAISGKTLRQANFTDNGDDTYTIHNAAGWGAFCDLLEGGTSFTGKTIYLNGNIEVSRMAGDSGHKFTGTFNGQGNTLTVSYGSAKSRISEQYAAPFRFVEGGTIENLRVSGDIYTSVKYAAGIIADQYGAVTITNCRSSVTINSSVSGDGTHGGFVAVNHNTSGHSLTIEGCVFDGSLLGASTYCCGGFIGWRGCTTEIRNSLFAPTTVTVSTSESATFARNKVDTYNCYYTNAFHDATYAPYLDDGEVSPAKWNNGIKACPAIAAPIGDATHATYSVSQITPYANGLTCGETFYYGGGENVSVSYVNESGYTVSHNCTALDPWYMPTSDLNGWYYVADDITYTQSVNFGADVTFILADGKTMNIGTSESPCDGYCIKGSIKDLTIYGQTNQSGTLNAYNDNDDAAAVKVSDYTQHGGNVNIDAKKYTALYPTFGNLTLTRGSLTVNGASHAIKLLSDYSATVSGGTLTATVSTYSAISGALALSGTATVKVTGGISGNVTIAAGQVFTDGNGHYYTGTLSDVEKTAIDGQTLTRLTALQLADAGDNSAAIDKCNGIAFPVTLQGRTLYKDGDWNTLCLPFAVSTTSGPLSGDNVTAMVLRTSDSGLSGTTLTLNFDAAPATIPAGTPFIIKWDEADNITDPVFTGVTIDNTNRDVAFTGGSFKGTYTFNSWTEETPSILLVGTGSTLYWPKPSGGDNPSLGACRAYFQLTPGASVREFNLNFGEGSGETGIICPAEIAEIAEMAGAWYSLDGRKLNAKPTTKGLYIHGGRKVVIP